MHFGRNIDYIITGVLFFGNLMALVILWIGATGGDSGGMSETDETSQNDANAAVMAHRSPRGKRPPIAGIILFYFNVFRVLCSNFF